MLRLEVGFNRPLGKTIMQKFYNKSHVRVFFNDEFNKSIDCFDYYYADSASLYLGRDFNQPFLKKHVHFPRVIFFGSRFNQPIDNLPDNHLTRIKFGNDFNHSIDSLGDSVVELHIGEHNGSDFNQQINHLSRELELFVLRIGPQFNKNINFEGTDKLRRVIFGALFNQLVYGTNYRIQEKKDEETLKSEDNVISLSNLEKPAIQISNVYFLCLGPEYSQSLNYLPDSIHYLNVGYEYGAWNDRADNVPEYRRKDIYFRKLSKTNYDTSTITRLPASLKCLRIATSDENIIELKKRFPDIICINNNEYVDVTLDQLYIRSEMEDFNHKEVSDNKC